MLIRFVIISCFCLFYEHSIAQLDKHLKEVIQPNKVGKVIEFNIKDKKHCEWTYLGILSTKNGQFHVVREFVRNKAAITWHGFSHYYLIDMKKRIQYVEDVGSPEYLPTKVKGNLLYLKTCNDCKGKGKVAAFCFERDIEKAQFSEYGDCIVLSKYEKY